nr:putative membrane protein [Quercus suber]
MGGGRKRACISALAQGNFDAGWFMLSEPPSVWSAAARHCILVGVYELVHAVHFDDSKQPVLPLHEATLQQTTFHHTRHETSHELELLSHASQIHYHSSSDSDEELIPREISTHHQMPPKKSKSRSPHPRGRHSTSGSLSSSNSIKDMNGAFRERAKHSSSLDVPEDSSVQTARLMNQSSFTLDEAPPAISTKDGGSGKSFFELPEQDRRNFLLLVLLYFLQGIPMGLAGGSVPFLLKSHMSYGQIGVYSLASYPYSLKLLWSPIVDALWSSRLGRRKSWILPIQALSGLGMIWLGTRAEAMMLKAGENDGAGIWGFTGWWFALVFMCATQDIAVDGWAITLISPANLSYASTAQTVGLTAGHFLSYTVFLALSSPDFANKYFRTIPLEQGLLTLNSYLTLWGWVYLIVTLGLAVLKREDKTKERESLWDVYKIMGGILKLRNIQIFIVIHLIAKIGFQANDAVTNLKLLDKGFSQEDLALTVLIDFPFEISLGYYAGKWSEQYQPIRVWCWAFIGRLGAAIFAQLVVMSFPAGGTTTFYLCIVILEHVYSTFMNTVMFVAISAFHAKIADPAIGGTYMTLLATKATCIPPTSAVKDQKGTLITQAFSCVQEADKHRCIDGGGICKQERDEVTQHVERSSVDMTSSWRVRMRVSAAVTPPARIPVDITAESRMYNTLIGLGD